MGVADLDQVSKACCPAETLRVTVSLARPAGARCWLYSEHTKPSRGFRVIHTRLG